eukprot:83907-Rhodomonas_salina.1
MALRRRARECHALDRIGGKRCPCSRPFACARCMSSCAMRSAWTQYRDWGTATLHSAHMTFS